MKHICTINTDASWCPDTKIGAYAYWIRSNGLFLRGSGVFKDMCKNSTEAEQKGIINALAILKNSGFKDIRKIIINRDNIYTKAGKKGTDLERKAAYLIRDIRRYCEAPKGRVFYEFRHVKAHSGTKDARKWVNDWCDKEAKKQLKKARYEKENHQESN